MGFFEAFASATAAVNALLLLSTCEMFAALRLPVFVLAFHGSPLSVGTHSVPPLVGSNVPTALYGACETSIHGRFVDWPCPPPELPPPETTRPCSSIPLRRPLMRRTFWSRSARLIAT